MLTKRGAQDIISHVPAREGLERGRSGGHAILENDIEKEEQNKQSDSEREETLFGVGAPGSGKGLNKRV